MKSIKIESEFELREKRFYIPYFRNVKCPDCGIINHINLEDNDYLSYPTINKKEDICFSCNECGSDLYFNITIRVSIDVEDEINKQ